MWCNSPAIALQIASAIVVLPVPDGPTNNHALGYGLPANAVRIFRGLSNPTNCAISVGWYFSLKGCGNCSIPVSSCCRLVTSPKLRLATARLLCAELGVNRHSNASTTADVTNATNKAFDGVHAVGYVAVNWPARQNA